MTLGQVQLEGIREERSLQLDGHAAAIDEGKAQLQKELLDWQQVCACLPRISTAACMFTHTLWIRPGMGGEQDPHC